MSIEVRNEALRALIAHGTEEEIKTALIGLRDRDTSPSKGPHPEPYNVWRLRRTAVLNEGEAVQQWIKLFCPNSFFVTKSRWTEESEIGSEESHYIKSPTLMVDGEEWRDLREFQIDSLSYLERRTLTAWKIDPHLMSAASKATVRPLAEYIFLNGGFYESGIQSGPSAFLELFNWQRATDRLENTRLTEARPISSSDLDAVRPHRYHQVANDLLQELRTKLHKLNSRHARSTWETTELSNMQEFDVYKLPIDASRSELERIGLMKGAHSHPLRVVDIEDVGRALVFAGILDHALSPTSRGWHGQTHQYSSVTLAVIKAFFREIHQIDEELRLTHGISSSWSFSQRAECQACMFEPKLVMSKNLAYQHHGTTAFERQRYTMFDSYEDRYARLFMPLIAEWNDRRASIIESQKVPWRSVL